MSKHSTKSSRGYVTHGAYGSPAFGSILNKEPKIERTESQAIAESSIRERAITKDTRVQKSWFSRCLHWIKTKIFRIKESV